MTATRHSHRHHRGTALALAILLSVVITGLVMCLALGASIQSSTTASLIRTEPAFYAAEYAAQDAAWRYKNDNTYRATSNSPRTSSLTIGGKTYNTVTTCTDQIGFPTIEWKFDEGAGPTTADNSGNGNTGTLVNCTWFTNGARQGPSCLYFDGASSYVNCGSSASTNINTNVTMSAWIKLTNASYDQKIGGNQNGSFGGYKFYIYNSKVIFEVRDSANNSTRNKNQPGGTVLAVNTWYHVAGLYSETNHWIKTYVNGQEEVTRRMTGLPANCLGLTTPQFIIGKEPFDTLYYFGGLIDDVRVYNSELSDAAIKAMYDTAVDVHSTATLVGTKNSSSAALTASSPLPPPPTLPEITVKNAMTLKGCTISGDVLVNSDLNASGLLPSTIDGNITYNGTYTPGLLISQLHNPPNKVSNTTVTVPTINTASITAQANQVYSGSQTGTTFTFTPLGGNKVIVVNGDVTDPQFDLSSGVFPSGGTLMINGKLTFTTNNTTGNSTNGVYVVCTGDCTQSGSAKLTLYGGLYVGGSWNRRDCDISGPVVVQGSITDAAGLPSTFTTGSVPWFDPRVITYNGAAALPLVFSSFHDDNN